MEQRIRAVARTVTREDQAREVLRVAALLAHVSGGVSSVEREVLSALAAEFKLSEGALAEALEEAASVLRE
jgi:tellurite resistance protein